MKRMIVGFVLGCLFGTGTVAAYGTIFEDSFSTSESADITFLQSGGMVYGDCDIEGSFELRKNYLDRLEVEVTVEDVSCTVY